MSDSSIVCPLPTGFSAIVGNIPIKDKSDDFVVVLSERRCAVAGVFTKSSFAGPSVQISREVVRSGSAQAFVVISKNANVANGPVGIQDAQEVVSLVAELNSVTSDDVLIASTGVIGQRYPMERVRQALTAGDVFETTSDAERVAAAMMTTDTTPKWASASGDGFEVVGVAKGVGMIEPDMATLIAAFFTDADIEADQLQAILGRVCDQTFNSLSIDTDTSTSDTAVALANGCGAEAPASGLEAAFSKVAVNLVKQLAVDGEGAETLIMVDVIGAASDEMARVVGKSIVNSPLVKTAVHGNDPNWGRIAMAIGKAPFSEIDPAKVKISIGEHLLYSGAPVQLDPGYLETYLAQPEITITVDLALGDSSHRVYGCDLTDGYIRINADYTT